MRFDLLFENLMDRGVHAADLRLLMDLYSRQRIRTLWKNKHSAYFGTQNGIRQGSIASPVLFCIYLDNLIKKLRRKGVGCWVGGSFFGALAYADDVALLCPSIGGLQEMVKMCEEFAAEWDLTFNSQKSMCLHFSRKKEEERRPVRLNGIELKWTSTFKYLGNHVSQDLEEREDVGRKRGDLFGRTNAVLAQAHGVSKEITCKIFKTQCAHLYGAETWSLADKNVPLIFTAINRCVRRVFDLPYRTHRRYLPIFARCKPYEEQIMCRTRKLISKMKNVNPSVSTLSTCCLHDARLISAMNVCYCDSYEPETTVEDNAIVQAVHELRERPPEFFLPDEV